jgi:ribosomal protein L29
VKTEYETDVVAWANEQAKFIRAGQFDQLDLIHLAEEIEDVGKSEQRELASRMAVLLAHLLKWQYQPSKQSKSWQHTLRTQRKDIAYLLNEAPSLRTKFNDAEWLDLLWEKAKGQAENETGLDIDTFPETCPWSMTDALQEGWLPVTH